MNLIGYDVVTLGNHEFDYGLEGLIECNKTLKCGYIIANFCYSKNKTTIFPKYVIKEIGKKKIGFIGLTTIETLLKTYLFTILDKKNEKVYSFLAGDEGEQLYSIVQNYINEIKVKGIDYVIILAHMGDNEDLKQYTSKALISNTIGINAIIDGHSHNVYSKIIKNKDGKEIPLVQTGSKLNNVGKLTIKTNGDVTSELISEIPEPKDKIGAEKVKRN